ncbi:MAG: hypothetical protein K1Y02_13350 [Candidatus Hydrogenedentes bacterium]|nr:hypothetical protein [Candidatus Hydrogenedentota bacterium]
MQKTEKKTQPSIETLALGVKPYEGFPSFAIPYCYTPNQLLDVVFRDISDRGVIRLVSYILYRQIRTGDRNGQPIDPQIIFPFNELQTSAGISRGALPATLQTALSLNLIECIDPGQAAAKGLSPRAAAYRLQWDHQQRYARNIDDFSGFNPFKGQRTWLPNDFFELVVPQEPLSCILVVAAILRQTVGWEDEFGYRRLEAALSISDIQRLTNLSRTQAFEGLKRALDRGYIERAHKGLFAPSGHFESTIYAPKWRDLNNYLFPELRVLLLSEDGAGKIRQNKQLRQSGSKSGTRPALGAVQNPVLDSEPQAVQKPVREQFKNRYETGSKSEPRSGSKSDTIKKTNKTTSIKQQQPPAVVEREIVSLLRNQGFAQRDAERLAEAFPEQQIRQQVEWLPLRNPGKNPTGLLRKAIEEDWNEPAHQSALEGADAELAKAFAAHFYAGLAGWEGDPIMEPSDKDITLAQSFISQLLKTWPDESRVPEWGRDFGRHVARETQEKKGIDPTLTYALKASKYGMQFYKQLVAERASRLKEQIERNKEEHLRKNWKSYIAYLRAEHDRLKSEDPASLEEFHAFRAAKKAEIESWGHMSAELKDRFLKEHDLPKTKSKQFADFFGYSFWTWDAEVNPESFSTGGQAA